MDKKTVNIHGKEYETVASRLQRFIADNQRYELINDILNSGQDAVTCRCEIRVYSDAVGDPIVIRRAVGHAYEQKGSSSINRTNHVENCETSAVGRALAFLGYGGDDSIASADEVITAIGRKDKLDKEPVQKAKPSAPTLGPNDIPDDQLGNWTLPDGFKKYAGMTLNQILCQVTDSGKNKGLEYLSKVAAAEASPGSKLEGYKTIIERYLKLIEAL